MLTLNYLYFQIYSVAAEHPSQFFCGVLFGLRMSKAAQYLLAQTQADRHPDSGLDTTIEGPHVGPSCCSVLMNIVVEQTNASYVCKRVVSI